MTLDEISYVVLVLLTRFWVPNGRILLNENQFNFYINNSLITNVS